MRTSLLAVVITLLCLLFAAPLFADNDRVRIHLKDGTVVEGELITFNDQTYRVKVGEEIKEIPWEQIDKIDILPPRRMPPAPQPVSPTAPASPTKTSTIPTIIDNLGQRFMTYPYRELLVAWIIDDSPSLEDEREIIKNEIDNLIFMLKDRKILNMAVVGFGKKALMQCGLTRDYDKIKKAIMHVGTDGSGTENCMAALDYSLKIFKTSSWKKIFILVTDEAGDDSTRLEEILDQLQKNDITVYALGGESSFAQPDSEEIHRDKEGKDDYVYINSGIESIHPEILGTAYSPIPFYLSAGIKYRIKSGFPPYALARLCDQTKGHYYFLKDSTYDRKIIKPYKPDLCSQEVYEALNLKDNLRSAVAGIRQELENFSSNRWFSDIQIQFYIPLDAKESLIEARNALPKINDYIKQLETAMPTTPSSITNKRWMANAELLLAQLYRIAYLLNQYILAVDEWINSKDFFNPRLARETTTHYPEYYYITIDPSAPIRKNLVDKKDYFGLCQKALDRVITNHSGTPWAVVAQEYKKDRSESGGYKIHRSGGQQKSESPKERWTPPPKKY
ncbi:MAG: VWA domain-containing protein [Planctomycetota bacterium]